MLSSLRKSTGSQLVADQLNGQNEPFPPVGYHGRGDSWGLSESRETGPKKQWVRRVEKRFEFLERVKAALMEALKPFVHECAEVETRLVRVRIYADHRPLDDIILQADGHGVSAELDELPF